MTQAIYCSLILLLSSSCQGSAKRQGLHLLPGKKVLQVAGGGSLIPVVKLIQINGSGLCDILLHYMRVFALQV